MTNAQAETLACYQELAQAETKLARTVSATAREVAHSECLDEEERAEVYAILHVIQSDSAAHLEILSELPGTYVSETGNV